jgi:hypothetical protein
LNGSERAILALLTILGNFSASSSIEILELVLERETIILLNFITAEKRFVLQRQAVRVMCNLVIVAPDRVFGIVMDLWLNILIKMMQSDDEMELSVLEALLSLMRWMEKDGNEDCIGRVKEELLDCDLEVVLERVEMIAAEMVDEFRNRLYVGAVCDGV